MPPSTTVWKLDAHTRAKHTILRKYLDAWLPIMSRHNGRVVFIDGFAGPGIYADGEDGSPIIALRAFAEHAHKATIQAEIVFLFVEEDSKRHAKLAEVVEIWRPQLPAQAKVATTCGEYAKELQRIVDEINARGTTLAPALVFIDPFGVAGIPLSLVRRIMAFPRCEVMITFMRSYAHRFVAAPEFETHLDAIYGGTDWRAARTLQGETRVQYLLDLYIAKLRDQSSPGGAKYLRPFTMADKKGVLIYDLIFASNHPTGIDRFKDALWKVDEDAGVRFSDAASAQQPTLFADSAGHDTALLNFLCHQFRGLSVSWPVLDEAIRNSPFRIRKSAIKIAASTVPTRLTISTGRAALGPTSIVTFTA